MQLGFSIDLLGLGISSEGDGSLYVPDAKREGMRADIKAQQQPTGEVTAPSSATR